MSPTVTGTRINTVLNYDYYSRACCNVSRVIIRQMEVFVIFSSAFLLPTETRLSVCMCVRGNVD
jgi:hypothetical protein